MDKESYLDGDGLLLSLDWLCIVSRVGSWVIITLASVTAEGPVTAVVAIRGTLDNKLMQNVA